MGSASNPFSYGFGETAFDEVDPEAVDRRKVGVESGVTLEPTSDFGSPVG